MFHIFEMLMLICFGISWPLSVYKTLKAKSANGKSVTFGFIIIFGYVCGITGKIVQWATGAVTEPVLFWITFAVYILNIIIVIIDTIITFYYKFKK